MRLRLAAPPTERVVVLDEAQRAVVAHEEGHLLVVGAPGTGKSTTAMATAVAATAVAVGSALPPGAEPAVLLTSSRRAAARLQELSAARLLAAAREARGLRVQTPVALAASILASRARALGEPPVALITGGEQDAILADLLAGHRRGAGAGVVWPAGIDPAAAELPAFRAELRDFMRRAVELGLRADDVSELGHRHGRPEWVAAAAVLSEYEAVTALGDSTPRRGRRYDDTQLLDVAAHTLETWHQEQPGAAAPHWGVVVVDDYHDATAATARLLTSLAIAGSRIVLFGDPDVALQGFRGGLPSLLEMATTRGVVGGFGAEQLVLPTVWRGTPELRRAVRGITESIATTGVARHRHADCAPSVALRAGADGIDTGADVVDGATRSGPEPHHVAADRAEGARLSGGAQPIGDMSQHGGAPPTGVEVSVLDSGAHEIAHIARQLRVEHLHHGTPWGQLAVIVRSASTVAALRRALSVAGVPVAVDGARLPLRAEPAVRPLLLALRVAIGARPSSEEIEELLLSPLGGMDVIGLRALRRMLRSSHQATPAETAELLVDIATGPGLAENLPGPYRSGPVRLSRILASGRKVAAEAAPLGGAASAHDVLWAIWDASALAGPWQSRALAGGPGGTRADADLDAVMTLFQAAERFDERQIGSGAGAFLDHIATQDIAADTIAAGTEASGRVAVLTPAGAAGQEWDVVVVAGLQEDVWPDLRLRDTLLGTRVLADIATGRHVATVDGAAHGGATVGGATADRAPGADPGGTDPGGADPPGGDPVGAARQRAVARREVLDDELRMLAVAVSRARRRVLATAVLDDEQRPSVFVDLLTGGAPLADLRREVSAPLDLRGLVAELRRRLEVGLTPPGSDEAPEMDDDRATADLGEQARLRDETSAAAHLLAQLAHVGVPGADPSQWAGLETLTTEALLRDPGQTVPVSPSAVEEAATCPLRWALTRAAGGTPADSTEQSLGTIVHSIAADHPRGSREELLDALDREWPSLDLAEGWVAGRTRRQAEQMIERLASYLESIPGEIDVERTVEADVGRAHVTGRVDRLEYLEEDGRRSARVVDFKTGASAVSRADAAEHPQLLTYQVAIEAGGAGADVASGGARLVYLGTSAIREQAPLADPEGHHAAVALVEEVAEIMSGHGFEARLNPGCRHCPVRTSCPVQPEGRRVTT